jgi:Zn-dependent protease
MLLAPLTLFIFILSISIHEFAHAWTADYLGDPTARLAGRKTLNPLAHIDLLGFAAMIFFGFGWAKPVPVNPYNLKNPRRDNLLVAFAGPASQIILSVILALIYHAVGFILTATPAFLILRELLSTFIQINLLLAFFNLLPLGPLDGFSVVLGLLPDKYVRQWEETKQYGLILLFMLILIPNRFFSLWTIINLPVSFMLNLLHI